MSVGGNFINILRVNFLYNFFAKSQNLTRKSCQKKTFVRKFREYDVDEIDHRCCLGWSTVVFFVIKFNLQNFIYILNIGSSQTKAQCFSTFS